MSEKEKRLHELLRAAEIVAVWIRRHDNASLPFGLAAVLLRLDAAVASYQAMP